MKKTGIVLIVLSLLIMSACSRGNGDKTAPANSEHPESVSVRMKWFFAGTMTPWFSGREVGVFARHGISLQITPGGPDNNAVKLVAAGSDLFGVAGADELLQARAKGIPVVAVAVLFKDSPICFISKEGSHIDSPGDWNNKVIEVSYGSNAEIQYRALLNQFHVTGVKEVPYVYSLAPLIEGTVDVSVAYRMDQVVTLQRKGVKLRVISPKTYGINPYGDVIITTEKTLREKPELVRSFVAASIESFAFAIQNEQDSVRLLVKAVPELKFENEIEVWSATVPFVVSNENVDTIGKMSPERWRQTMTQMIEFGGLNAPVDLAKAAIAP